MTLLFYLLCLLGAGLLVVVLVLVAGLLHMRRSIRVAEAAIERVSAQEIAALRDECVSVFAEAFGERLDLEDFEESSLVLSGRLDASESLKQAFAKDDFYWYFVLPVGAFLGELLRVHVNGSWRESEELEGLEMAIPVAGETVQTFPFHKIIKHVTTGDPGDVYAYLESSRQLDKIVERLDAEDPPAS